MPAPQHPAASNPMRTAPWASTPPAPAHTLPCAPPLLSRPDSAPAACPRLAVPRDNTGEVSGAPGTRPVRAPRRPPRATGQAAGWARGARLCVVVDRDGDHACGVRLVGGLVELRHVWVRERLGRAQALRRGEHEQPPQQVQRVLAARASRYRVGSGPRRVTLGYTRQGELHPRLEPCRAGLVGQPSDGCPLAATPARAARWQGGRGCG